ncbi:MAG: GTP cyclohydrolase II [Pseudomonadota bacterium]
MTISADIFQFSTETPSAGRYEHVLMTVQAAIAAARLGKPFLVREGQRLHLCQAVDGVSEDGLRDFKALQVGRSPVLILTGERADILGFEAENPISVPMTTVDTPQSLYAIAADHPAKVNRRPVYEEADAKAALRLLTIAKLLPACLFYGDVAQPLAHKASDIPVVDVEAITDFADAKLRSMRRKSEAPIPVRGGIETRMVVFEYATGETEIALLVGKPQLASGLTIRIHSACVTGDIFGSERCDCGDQLRLSIEKLHELGGGAVLYLDQEGRGIGLSNKIRAYELQDQALDTVDANRTLGFGDDMREYAMAAAMVRALGWQSVSILTNNPNKVSALEAQGLTVEKRIPHQAPMNENNSHYLQTKARRSGHMLTYKS